MSYLLLIFFHLFSRGLHMKSFFFFTKNNILEQFKFFWLAFEIIQIATHFFVLVN